MDSRYGGYRVGKVPVDAKRRERSRQKTPLRVDLRTFLTSVESQVGNSYPIAFALNTIRNFDGASRNKGHVPMPKADAKTRNTHGWHAMLCVGYSDIDRVFIVRNSWGREWVDKGYCHIPYDYVMHDSHNAHDSWVIKSVENRDYSEDVEVEGEEGFIERLEALIGEYVESEDVSFFDHESDDDGVFIQFGEFYLLADDPDGFLEELDARAEEFGGEDGYDYSLDTEEE